MRRKLSSASSSSPSSPSSSSLVIVGLGNPGPEYDLTRHNIGFHVLDAFAALHNVKFQYTPSLNCNLAVFTYNGRTIHLVKPTTFMNFSGNAVSAVFRHVGVSKQSLLIVVDDMNLELGKIRYKLDGSSGGHNGLKHVESKVGGRKYARIKVGVGMKKEKMSDEGVQKGRVNKGKQRGKGKKGGKGNREGKMEVLKKLNKKEMEVVEDMTDDCLRIMDKWLTQCDMEEITNMVGILNTRRGM